MMRFYEASYKPSGMSEAEFAAEANLLHEDGRWRIQGAPATTLVLAGADVLRDEGRRLWHLLADAAEAEAGLGLEAGARGGRDASVPSDGGGGGSGGARNPSVLMMEFPGQEHDFVLLPGVVPASAAAGRFVLRRLRDALAGPGFRASRL